MRLIWLDTETSGLDPLRHTILELAVGVADLANPFDLLTRDRFVLRYTDAHTRGTQCQEPGDGVVGLGTDDGPCAACNFSPEARALHEKNGLLVECARATATMGGVEERLLVLIEGEPERGEGKPTLAGSTVHFDRGFLRAAAPRFTARLSHRHYCESLGMPRLAKAEAHRALEDILESVDHARRCVQRLARRAYSYKEMGL